MPGWLLSLISTLAYPALKVVLKVVLTSLEKKFPGIKPLVDAILNFLENGGTAETVLTHCQAMPEFCGADLKQE